MLLFALYSNFTFPFITVIVVLLTALFGAIVAPWATGSLFAVSPGIGFLGLFGVSVLTAVVYLACVNALRPGGTLLPEAVSGPAILRL